MSAQDMPTQKVTYKFLGIPLWSVIRTVDAEKLYKVMSEKFAQEMTTMVKEARGEQ